MLSAVTNNTNQSSFDSDIQKLLRSGNLVKVKRTLEVGYLLDEHSGHMLQCDVPLMLIKTPTLRGVRSESGPTLRDLIRPHSIYSLPRNCEGLELGYITSIPIPPLQGRSYIYYGLPAFKS